MKNKTLVKVKAGIAAFFKVLLILFSIVLIGAAVVTLPVLGYIYQQKSGLAMGILISVLLFYVGIHVYRSIKKGTFKALLVHFAEVVESANYAVLIMCLILLLVGFPFDIKNVTWLSYISFYYCYVIPFAVGFSFLMAFGFKGLEEIFEKYNSFFAGNCTAEEKESWKREKFRLKYFNPIVLPFSIVFFLIRFVLKSIKIISLGIKMLFQKMYQESLENK